MEETEDRQWKERKRAIGKGTVRRKEGVNEWKTDRKGKENK